MANIKISIIVPIYNAEKYLRPLLDSIAAQTERNFEMLAIDDGSKDNSVSILREYDNKIPHLRVISQPNSGVSVARNNGIAAACGEYFCFCDSDDILSPNYLSIFCRAIEQYSPDVGVCEYRTFYGNEPTVETNNSSVAMKDLCASRTESVFTALSLSGLSTQIGNKFYKTSLVNLFHIEFTPGSAYGEDMFFNWKVIMASKSVVKIDASLYFYRMAEGTASVKYHHGLYDSYKKEYSLLREFATKIGATKEDIDAQIFANAVDRIPALVRMSVRRKKGIRTAFRDIKAITSDDFMREAVTFVLNGDNLVKENIVSLATLVKNQRIAQLWFYGFKSEMRISLGRKLKNRKGKK